MISVSGLYMFSKRRCAMDNNYSFIRLTVDFA